MMIIWCNIYMGIDFLFEKKDFYIILLDFVKFYIISNFFMFFLIYNNVEINIFKNVL